MANPCNICFPTGNTTVSYSHRSSPPMCQLYLIPSLVAKYLPKVKVINTDAFVWLEQNQDAFDFIVVDFPDPSKIGADRLANAVAVGGQGFPGPVVVVDFGTAVTFDIIDSRPAYIGGVIAPGLDAMRHYLHQRTALLPEIDIARPESAIGKSTVHAMQSGAFHGYRGLVKEILREIEREMGTSAKVIATGGYASLIAEGLPEIESVQPYLTLEGLLRVALLNFPQ